MNNEALVLIQYFVAAAVVLSIPLAFLFGFAISVGWAIRLVFLCVFLFLVETMLFPKAPFDLAAFVRDGTMPAQSRRLSLYASMIFFLLIYIALRLIFSRKSRVEGWQLSWITAKVDAILMLGFSVLLGIIATQAIGFFIDGSLMIHLAWAAFAALIYVAVLIRPGLPRPAYFLLPPFFAVFGLLMAFGGIAYPSLVRNSAETVAQGKEWCLLVGPDFTKVPDTRDLLLMNIPEQDLLLLVVGASSKPSYWRWSRRGLAFMPLQDLPSAFCPSD